MAAPRRKPAGAEFPSQGAARGLAVHALRGDSLADCLYVRRWQAA